MTEELKELGFDIPFPPLKDGEEDVSGISLMDAASSIVVLNGLLVQLTYTSITRSDGCEVNDLDRTRARLSVTSPSAPESTALTISNRDIFGGEDCRGYRFEHKDVNPLGGEKGTYILRLTGDAHNWYHPWVDLSQSQFPSLRIFADGRLVVDVAFPAPRRKVGEPGWNRPTFVDERWPITFQ